MTAGCGTAQRRRWLTLSESDAGVVPRPKGVPDAGRCPECGSVQVGQMRDEEVELDEETFQRRVVGVRATWWHCWTCNEEWDRQEA
jgi:hypothetical protein